MTCRPLSGWKSAGCWATILSPSPQSALIVSAKPLLRSVVTEMPAMPWISTTFPLQLSLPAMNVAALTPIW